MWINLPRQQLEIIAGRMVDSDPQLAAQIHQWIKDAFDPMNGHYVESAKERHEDEGTVEIDDQSDGSALVSYNDEGGAYVLAWVYVRDEDVPEGRSQSDDEEDEDGE